MHYTPLQKAPLGRVLPEYEIPTPRPGMNRLRPKINLVLVILTAAGVPPGTRGGTRGALGGEMRGFLIIVPKLVLKKNELG